MKKILTLVLFGTFLFGATATGYGDSKKEARANAKDKAYDNCSNRWHAGYKTEIEDIECWYSNGTYKCKVYFKCTLD